MAKLKPYKIDDITTFFPAGTGPRANVALARPLNRNLATIKYNGDSTALHALSLVGNAALLPVNALILAGGAAWYGLKAVGRTLKRGIVKADNATKRLNTGLNTANQKRLTTQAMWDESSSKRFKEALEAQEEKSKIAHDNNLQALGALQTAETAAIVAGFNAQQAYETGQLNEKARKEQKKLKESEVESNLATTSAEKDLERANAIAELETQHRNELANQTQDAIAAANDARLKQNINDTTQEILDKQKDLRIRETTANVAAFAAEDDAKKRKNLRICKFSRQNNLLTPH